MPQSTVHITPTPTRHERRRSTMFVQFIEGKVSDAAAFRDRMDRWHTDCAPGAIGWIGATAGVTADGTGFVAARFESTEAARANSDRPEQSAWWAETEPVFDGSISFVDCDHAEVFGAGGSDDAGFVQVIRGTVDDVDAARRLFLESPSEGERPDVIGGLLALGSDGRYTMVVYFTSETEARAAEAEGSDDEFIERMLALHVGRPRFLDIEDPWMWSA
jgi:hypothetical protein